MRKILRASYFPGLVPFTVVILIGSCSTKEDPAFVEEEMEWRQSRDQQMRNPSSWLTIAGLFWLQDGDNTFGTDPSNRFQLVHHVSWMHRSWMTGV